jgi:hypothetical protein
MYTSTHVYRYIGKYVGGSLVYLSTCVAIYLRVQ